jgi:hypothetical protein
MPMSPEEFYAHVMKAADAGGRLPLSRMTGWDVFPFEHDRGSAGAGRGPVNELHRRPATRKMRLWGLTGPRSTACAR